MNSPDLLIVTDQQRLFAYMVNPDGHAQVLEHVDFRCDGPTSVPLIEWSSNRNCYGLLADRIVAILKRYRPKAWGLACPDGMMESLGNFIPFEIRDRLAALRSSDDMELTVANVVRAFGHQLLEESLA